MAINKGLRDAYEVDEGTSGTHAVEFDVTCVIGRVVSHPDGTLSPTMAAWQMIAEHDAEGIYSFPMADGRTARITVEYV